MFGCIAGLTKPTSGEVLLHDKLIEEGDIGVVAQNHTL
jgi:ABC-type sugar transport system ATPase subunit